MHVPRMIDYCSVHCPVTCHLQVPACFQAENTAAKAAGLQVPKAFVFNTFFWTRLACFGKPFDYAGALAKCNAHTFCAQAY